MEYSLKEKIIDWFDETLNMIFNGLIVGFVLILPVVIGFIQ